MKVRIILAVFALCLAGASAEAQEVLYGANSDLLILDPATGAVITTVGPIGLGARVTGLAVDPATGILYGSTGREFGNSGFLITINKTTGAGTLVGDLQPLGGETAADLTFTSDGTLYGWLVGSGTDDLVTINKLTGLATVVGDSGIGGAGNGLAASSSDVLFYSGDGDNGPLRTVNRTTGAVSAGVTMTGTMGSPINAMAFNAAGTLYGSLRDGNLITINSGTGAITVLSGTPNVDAIVFDGGAASAIPTLSEWMLLLLALSVAGIGFAMLRRSL